MPNSSLAILVGVCVVVVVLVVAVVVVVVVFVLLIVAMFIRGTLAHTFVCECTSNVGQVLANKLLQYCSLTCQFEPEVVACVQVRYRVSTRSA